MGEVQAICLGGGHSHTPVESDHCESACTHDGIWRLLAPADHHDDCGCTHLEFMNLAILASPRGSAGALTAVLIAPNPNQSLVFADSGRGCWLVPRAPPWLDPVSMQRREVLSTVRLII